MAFDDFICVVGGVLMCLATVAAVVLAAFTTAAALAAAVAATTACVKAVATGIRRFLEVARSPVLGSWAR